MEMSQISQTAETGSFIAFVLDAGGAIPITGATVRVYGSKQMEEEPIAVLKSGEDGRTNEFLSAALSSLTVEVEQEGYYSFRSNTIPIYAKVTSIQPVYMIPIPEWEEAPEW